MRDNREQSPKRRGGVLDRQVMLAAVFTNYQSTNECTQKKEAKSWNADVVLKFSVAIGSAISDHPYISEATHRLEMMSMHMPLECSDAVYNCGCATACTSTTSYRIEESLDLLDTSRA